MTNLQLRILVALSEDWLSGSEVVDKVTTDGGGVYDFKVRTVYDNLAKMVKRGWVRRELSRSDRVVYHLTAPGRRQAKAGVGELMIFYRSASERI